MKKKAHQKVGDVESARLRLALLKENSRYRKFFSENKDRILGAYQEWREAVLENRFPLHQIPPVNRFGEEISWEDSITGISAKGFFGPINYVHTWFHQYLEENFGIVTPPFNLLMPTIGGRCEALTPEESLDLLDPMKDIENIPERKREAALVAMFSAYGIRQLIQDDSVRERFPEQASMTVFELEQRRMQYIQLFQYEGRVKHPFWFKGKINLSSLSGLQPHERLLIVDLRMKKAQLLKEFDEFLDVLYRRRKETKEPEWISSYNLWGPDTTRTRAETWEHLKVWKLRRQRKGFLEIARSLKMAIGTAKMSFYRAHVLIEGCPYDRKKYKLDHWNLRECHTCPEHPNRGGTCQELCPDMEILVGGNYAGENTYDKFNEIEAAHLHDKWLTEMGRQLQTKEEDEPES